MENTFGVEYLESMDVPCYQGGGTKMDKATCMSMGGVWAQGYCKLPQEVAD